MRLSRVSFILAIYAGGLPALGQQWATVVLHPEGAYYSEVKAVTPSRQGGFVHWPSQGQAVLWSGTAGSWVGLSPLDHAGYVYGMDNMQQVGSYQGATLWRGSPESRVDLSVPGTISSGALATCGQMQVGIISLGTSSHAALWRGTASSFVDLHPAGAVRSACTATDGLLQGGTSDWQVSPTTVQTHASTWNGTAQSFVDLRPSGDSHVYGMAPGVQVGDIAIPASAGASHAAVWHGSAASFVDLNPSGATETILYATTGRIHVGGGNIYPTGLGRALINFGAVDSWLDLHQFLPPQFSSFSAATSVCQDGDTIYVGGWAEAPSGDHQAILWIGHIPCYANCDQSSITPMLNVNDFMCFLNQFAAGDAAANCDQSTAAPSLNANDFQCFINRFASGCS